MESTVVTLLFILLGARAAAQSPFTVDLGNARCPDLVEKDSSVAPDAASCAALCSEDLGCDLWQYCPEDHVNCRLHSNRWSPNDGSVRCYVSSSTSSREMCIPDGWNRWIGSARTGSNRLPTRTAPVTRKRGFSGFLKQKINGNLQQAVCQDSEALGLENSWYYNWMTTTSSNDFCRNNENLWGSGSNGNGGGGTQMGGEFVPMLRGVGVAAYVLGDIDKWKAEWSRANVHYLLGYNEPDPADNHPMSVEAAEAAFDWVKVQEVAASFDPPLILVSPGKSNPLAACVACLKLQCTGFLQAPLLFDFYEKLLRW